MTASAVSETHSDTTANGAVLDIRQLSRRFGDRDVVSSLDLAVSLGERVALRGANGSGKTTVLRCIAGTLVPSGGRITVAGHPAGAPEARRRLGASLSQERSFYLRLSGRANLRFYASLRYETRAQASRALEALCEELELGSFLDKRVDRCSSGMIQQLGFARALLGNPSLLLLDEPTKSLDAEARERLWSALERRPDVAVVLATHLEEDFEHCGRRLEFPT
jgi:ABC-2 type transport system ATP-binding protein